MNLQHAYSPFKCLACLTFASHSCLTGWLYELYYHVHGKSRFCQKSLSKSKNGWSAELLDAPYKVFSYSQYNWRLTQVCLYFFIFHKFHQKGENIVLAIQAEYFVFTGITFYVQWLICHIYSIRRAPTLSRVSCKESSEALCRYRVHRITHTGDCPIIISLLKPQEPFSLLLL